MYEVQFPSFASFSFLDPLVDTHRHLFCSLNNCSSLLPDSLLFVFKHIWLNIRTINLICDWIYRRNTHSFISCFTVWWQSCFYFIFTFLSNISTLTEILLLGRVLCFLFYFSTDFVMIKIQTKCKFYVFLRQCDDAI